MAGLPPELLVEPMTRSGNSKECKKCGKPGWQHSLVCRICRDYDDHHDAERSAGCIAGQVRMASARQRAGVELDDVDRLVLSIQADP